MKETLPIISPVAIANVLRKSVEHTVSELSRSLKQSNLALPKSNAFKKESIDTTQARVRNELDLAIKILSKTETLPGVLSSMDHQMASLLQTFLVQQGLEEQKIVEVENSVMKAREVQFDEHDWSGWAKSFFSWWKKISPHPWINTPSNKKINNTARIGILGDWGTGLYGAPICARSIENSKEQYDSLIHLGDVYYSGDTKETKERFLDLWIDPSKSTWEKKDSVIHRACNSNHEMYTGGHAYFNYTLSKFEQSASYFALHNDYWILAGLDTGYKEGDLMDGQVEWLEDLISKSEGRRIILFSHHQPFSWFEKGYTKITNKLDKILKEKKISAWYWGHEHRCVLYDKHPVYGLYGRCVGHSGYPYFRDNFTGFKSEAISNDSNNFSWKFMPSKDKCPSAKILDGSNIYVEGYEVKYGANGYMTLNFVDDKLFEIVNDADGNILYSRQINI
jgi:Calcineurin-like phosphoesterase